MYVGTDFYLVSTHSRPKAAERYWISTTLVGSFNTQPPEGGCAPNGIVELLLGVSTHSRPKAAGQARRLQ